MKQTVVIRKIIDSPSAGDNIAFFVGTKGEYGKNTIQAYMNVGQHGPASKEFAVENTVSTKLGIDCHGSLKKELEDIGYENIVVTDSLEELGHKPKCLYCNSGNEPTHFICESCGDGMCDECFDSPKEHDSHYQNPAENAEDKKTALVLEDAFGDGYGCEACVNKVLTMHANELKENEL